MNMDDYHVQISSQLAWTGNRDEGELVSARPTRRHLHLHDGQSLNFRPATLEGQSREKSLGAIGLRRTKSHLPFEGTVAKVCASRLHPRELTCCPPVPWQRPPPRLPVRPPPRPPPLLTFSAPPLKLPFGCYTWSTGKERGCSGVQGG